MAVLAPWCVRPPGCGTSLNGVESGGRSLIRRLRPPTPVTRLAAQQPQTEYNIDLRPRHRGYPPCTLIQYPVSRTTIWRTFVLIRGSHDAQGPHPEGSGRTSPA